MGGLAETDQGAEGLGSCRAGPAPSAPTCPRLCSSTDAPSSPRRDHSGAARVEHGAHPATFTHWVPGPARPLPSCPRTGPTGPEGHPSPLLLPRRQSGEGIEAQRREAQPGSPRSSPCHHSWRAGRLCGGPGPPPGQGRSSGCGQCPSWLAQGAHAYLAVGHSGRWQQPGMGVRCQADRALVHSCVVRTGTECPRSWAGVWRQGGQRTTALGPQLPPGPRLPTHSRARGLRRPRTGQQCRACSRGLYPCGSIPPWVQMTYHLPNRPQPCPGGLLLAGL